MASNILKLKKISKVFQDNNGCYTEILKNISLDVSKHQFITFFGPNGCGKTTLLKIIAKLINKTSGNIVINKNISNLKTSFVFQKYEESLLPWRTVYHNICLPLENKVHKNKLRKLIEKKMILLRIKEYSNKFPYELSGGKQQLVAICRAIITNPDILLLDEPLSSLDYDTTIEMQKIILKLHQLYQITTIYVSHNIDDAILLSDKIVILGNTPTTIKKIIDINLSRPRNHNMLLSTEFIKLKKKILEVTYEN